MGYPQIPPPYYGDYEFDLKGYAGMRCYDRIKTWQRHGREGAGIHPPFVGLGG